MHQDETSVPLSGTSEGRAARTESLRDKVVATAAGFVLTGVIGTMVATWFQERGWAWQNAVGQVEKDTASTLASLQSVSDLLDKRWSATFQMVQATENTGAGDASNAAKNSFFSVNREWELSYANVDATVQFNVDRPFGIDAKQMPKTLWALQCKTFPFGSEAEGGVKPDSAHTILTVIDHCHDLVKTDIIDLNKPLLDQTTRKRLIDESYLRLSQIYHINDALRCVILERAITMRGSLDTELGWGSFFWIGPQKYSIPTKEGQCIDRYRKWSEVHR